MKLLDPIVHFLGIPCRVVVESYRSNGRLALELVAADDSASCDAGEPVAVASVNLTDVPMMDEEVAIKDYSENEGMLDALMAAGIVLPPMRHVASGFVDIPICLVGLPVREALALSPETTI